MLELNEKQIEAKNKICLPLDNLKTIDEVKAQVEKLSSVVGLFKVGKELFTRFGPEVVKLVHTYDAKVFLDLKYHDIPNTVKEASRAAAELGVYMFNVHASGGMEMMKAALEGISEFENKPKIIAVTILTSIDENSMHEIGFTGEVDEQVLRLAKLTEKAGLDGIVCSSLDLERIKPELKNDFMFVTPGIKGVSTDAGSDQKRVNTPGNAIRNGSSVLVVGRAITGADNPEREALEIIHDMCES